MKDRKQLIAELGRSKKLLRTLGVILTDQSIQAGREPSVAVDQLGMDLQDHIPDTQGRIAIGELVEALKAHYAYRHKK